jgi:hypothetical protein
MNVLRLGPENKQSNDFASKLERCKDISCYLMANVGINRWLSCRPSRHIFVATKNKCRSCSIGQNGGNLTFPLHHSITARSHMQVCELKCYLHGISSTDAVTSRKPVLLLWKHSQLRREMGGLRAGMSESGLRPWNMLDRGLLPCVAAYEKFSA